MRAGVRLFSICVRVSRQCPCLSAFSIPTTPNRPILRGGRSPWFAAAGHPARREVSENLKCDALIVGAGITGSLVAERLTRQGLDVVIVDRELPGRGSTAASTSMLLWEIDRSLTELTEAYGFERASRAYRASLDAVTGLKSLVLQLGIACDMHDRDSLYLAAGDTGRRIDRGASPPPARRSARRFSRPCQAAGYLWNCARRRDRIKGRAPIPIRCSWRAGCSMRRVARGARLFDGEAVHVRPRGGSVGVAMANGREIEARSVILATGYTMPDIVHSTVHAVSSSWAIATTPQPQNIWKDAALIWENSKDYHYARTTRAGRIIIGGEDSEDIIEPDARDRLIPRSPGFSRKACCAMADREHRN